ncbi:hypothetical protein JVU11DRAFT_1461 [Chiua virens]|nr:hypothetical protein JVU11DRAFT_1461 [Chiua virens]
MSETMTEGSTSPAGPSQRDNVLLRWPAITTVVLLTTLIVPVAVLPYYALVRRRISRLTSQVDHLVTANTDLQNVVSKSAHDIALRREELGRAISLLEKSKSEISLLRRDISQTQTQLQSFQSTTRAELQSFSDEGKLTRQALPTCASLCNLHPPLIFIFLRHRFDLFPQIGLSLADVAAFMHEVELHQGIPPSATHNRSIERLRALALKLQVAPDPHKVSHAIKASEQISFRGSLDNYWYRVNVPLRNWYLQAINETLRPIEVNFAVVL